LTDDLIIRAMGARPSGIMTYVIRNILAMEHGFRGLKTSAILSRLKRLERAGRVRRVPTSYAVMLCWALEIETPDIPGVDDFSDLRLLQLSVCQGRRQQHGEGQCAEKDGSCAACVADAINLAPFYSIDPDEEFS
jgi:hypothetical protein